MEPFQKLTVCLDMHGCPNRCRHCWLGVTPSGTLNEEDLRFVAAAFRPYTQEMEVFDWYREPDFHDGYQKRWELTQLLSDSKTPHFELASFWRAVRDPEYVPWLYGLGVRAVQLTVFGSEKTTDWFFGRRGAYQEILKTIDILLDNGIAPRIQTFVYQRNIDELPHILTLIRELKLKKRCQELGRTFEYFLHQGTCDGENEKLYEDWITPSEIDKIPQKLVDETLRYFQASSLQEVLGETEQELCKMLMQDHSVQSLVVREPVFYVDKNFDVYPNLSTPSPSYCLGNLKAEGAGKVVDTYCKNRSLAQNIRLTVPVSEMVKACGTPDSQRLFKRGDYMSYIHNRYCRQMIS